MYNILFGRNPNADFILATIGLKKEQVGRFRDVWVEKDRIAIHTRLGASNRWVEGDEDLGPCSDVKFLQSYPGYISDEDMTDDNTYANFYYKIPEKYKGILEVNDRTPDWNAKIEQIKGMSAEELRKKYPEIVGIIDKIVESTK